jgi:PAS domain S-box-containing protein
MVTMMKNKHKSVDVNLIKNQSRLEVILDGIQDVIYISDPETYELLYVNNAFQDSWGEVQKGKKCYQVLQDREDPCPFCTNHLIFGEHLGQTHVWEFQNQVTGRHYRCADRAVRWLDERWVRFEIAADITSRVQAEQALKKSEQRYRNFLDNFHGIAFQSHLDYTPIFFEGDVEQITGYRAQDFTAGKPRWDEIIHPGDRERLYRDYPPEIFQEMGNGVEREYRIIDQAGAVRWVRDTIQAIEEDGELILQGSIFDISRQKEAERELKESEASYRALAEASPEMIFMIDRQDRVMYLNPAAAEMFRVNPEDMIGTPRLELFPPQVAENQARGLEYVLSTGEKVHAESQVSFPKGDMWLSTWLVPIREGDQIQAVLGISQDITRRHQAGVELENKITELERFNRMAVDREMRMLELKREVNQLLLDRGEKARYSLPQQAPDAKVEN